MFINKSSIKIVFFNLLFFILLSEIFLRLFPSIIPIVLLSRFNEDLRPSVAERLGLNSKNNIIKYERNDGGNPNKAYRHKSFLKLNRIYNDENVVRSIILDELGMCNPNESNLDTVDIITIGDSFTWCTAVAPNETFTYKLAQLSGLSTYNLSRGGIGIHEYIQQLINFGLNKNPKYVIMNIYEGNDLRDAFHHHQYKEKYKVISKKEKSLMRQVLSFVKNNYLAQNSYSYNILFTSLHFIIKPKSKVMQDDLSDLNFHYELLFPKYTQKFNLDNADTDEIYFAEKIFEDKINFLLFDDGLENFLSLAKLYNFKPIVTYIPSAHTAYDKYSNFEEVEYKTLLANFSKRQRNYFKKRSMDLGYQFIDTTSLLQQAIEKKSFTELLYYPYNLHLTAQGHFQISKIINDLIYLE